ncbi:Glycine zipper 2TM domain-containing protein [Polaromonas sp. YR568]|uniref:glycine zipper 2TM domain-containing protein n=1 Tax=Polaromonas sp. YR568 TaxID=1855301 RepID=UPI0008EC3DC6|nr:glycine zipper 2TM domain-containing protein [Polaromonas sp. YR568]SFU74328.1 Glycine zipper 2TM domain-containing protein [Polaromonas sp. YR568]
MNTSTETLQPGQQASSASKPLWAAVGILGVAVLAMGATMIYQMRNPPAAAAPVALASPQATAPVTPPAAAAATAADDLAEKPTAAPAKPAPVPAKKVVKPTPKPVPAPSYAGVSPAPAPYPAPVPMAVCHSCGAIESVTPIERSTKPAGVGIGTVAGGVLGAVLGNQIGHGGGRTAATILGAVGGGFAGNAIEGHVRKETVYQVGVRMEDGSQRLVEVAQAPAVGSRVTVEGNVLRSHDGAVYGPKPPPAPVATQPAPSPYYSGGR